MTPEEAVEIIRGLLPKQSYVPYRTVMKRKGKGLITEVIPLSVEEESLRFQGLSINGHVLTRPEITEYVTSQRLTRQTEFDRIYEAFDMLCEAIRP